MVIKNREVYGKYEVRRHPGGGFSVHHPSMRVRGYYVPPDSRLLERYQREGITPGLVTTISYRAVIDYGKRSISLGKKSLGIPPGGNPVAKDEVEKAIKSFWNPEDVKKFLDGEVSLGTITEFRKSYERQYHAAQRTYGGFRKFFESVYPGTYVKILKIVRIEDWDLESIKQEILLRHYAGIPISRPILENSPDISDRKLVGRLKVICKSGKHELFRSKRSFTKFVCDLTGLKRHDIAMDTAAYNEKARLAERLTEMAFSWAHLLGVQIDGVPPSFVSRDREDTTFFYNNSHEGRADLRVGNSAVEVKTRIHLFRKDYARELIEKYSQGANWKSGESLENSLVIFHANEDLYKKYVPELKTSGINIMGYEQFHEFLAKLLGEMKDKFPSKLREVYPRIHNLDYILSLHEEVSLHPHLLTRKGNRQRLNWSKDVVNALIEKAREQNAQRN